jgi:adenine phosphoribosyltransferase
MDISGKVRSVVRDVADYPRPGILFKDITPLLLNPALTHEAVNALAHRYEQTPIDAVAAIEARGFILGSLLARELACAFVPVRKAGKLPYHTLRQRYDLEYGSAEIEIHVDAVKPGAQVLIHDDLLATGGTAAAAGRLIKALGGEVVGFSFLVNLAFLEGQQRLEAEFGCPVDSLVTY